MSLRILLSNDDGIFAPGILALKKALDDDDARMAPPSTPAIFKANNLHKQ
jgi:broad specificity polyphosphatase/5'/3'-nucleotidase SurE